MLFLSALFVLLFLGGWDPGFGLGLIVNETTMELMLTPWVAAGIFATKTICFLFFFVWVRATLPRYRYDQLMELGWKFFLPFTFSFFIFLLVYLFLTTSLTQHSDLFFSYTLESSLMAGYLRV